MMSINLTTLRGTCLGFSAVAMWSMSASVAKYLEHFPTLETLALSLFVCFALTAIVLSMQGRWSQIRAPWQMWLAGIVGVFGNDFCYFKAFEYAPAVQVDLISYLWPIFIVLGSSLLPDEKLKWSHVVGAIICFTGIYLLLNGGFQRLTFQWQYLTGYVLALGNALTWTVYSLAARYYRQSSTEMMGIYCGCGALAAMVFHVTTETFVVPTSDQFIAIVLLGLTCQGAAYFLWDIGVKFGNVKLLSLLTYTAPFFSVLWLACFGFANLTPLLLIACAFVVSGCAVASIDWSDFFKPWLLKRFLITRVT